MILRFILYALGIYMVYKLVFDLVIPVFRTTQKIRRQFGDMQQHMNNQMNAEQNGQPGQRQSQPATPPKPTGKAGDYIDFEEVKESR